LTWGIEALTVAGWQINFEKLFLLMFAGHLVCFNHLKSRPVFKLLKKILS
jgi:hypothetical protein